MPLDRVNGEVLDGFSSRHVVVDFKRLAEMTNLLVKYDIPGKFRSRKGTRPLFDDAMTIARDRFIEAGALLPVAFDESSVMAQAYPEENRIAVVVTRSIAGKEHFVVRDYDLPKSVIDHLLGSASKSARAH